MKTELPRSGIYTALPRLGLKSYVLLNFVNLPKTEPAR